MSSALRAGLVALVAGAALLAAPAAPAAAATTTTTSLPIDRASAVALDETHGHLFVSTGPGRDQVLVTDLSGAPVRTLSGLAGASGLLVDGPTLYVALADAHAVAAVDTGTLTETARWAVPEGLCPRDLTGTAGKVVFTADDCTSGSHSARLAALVPGTGAVALTDGTVGSDPVIAANAASDGLVALAETYAQPSVLQTFSVAGDVPVATGAAGDAQPITDLAMAPDAKSVFVSGQNGYQVPLDALTYGRYLTPSAVAAWSADGSLVTASGGTATVWPAAGPATSSGVNAPSGTEASHGRLVVDATAATAWVVSTGLAGTDPPVLVRYDLRPTGTRWVTSSSRIVVPAYTTATLRADAYVDGQAVPDGVRMVVLVDQPDGTSTTQVYYTQGGGITLSLFPPPGVTRYRFSYYDDASRQVAYAYTDVVGSYGTVLDVSDPPSPVDPGQYLSWFGRLTDAGGVALTGRRVDLSRLGPDGETALGYRYTDGQGYVSFTDVAGAPGSYTYFLRYAGDEAAAPATHQTDVVVQQLAGNVWIEASRGTGRHGRTATVTGHLGNFHTNRVLTITATPDGGSTVVIAQGDAGDDLALTAQYTMKKATTFTVIWDGDDWYSAAQSSTRLTLR